MIKVKIVNKSDFPLPKYETYGSSGMDLKANINNETIIKSFERFLVPTGIHIELPLGYEAQVRARSGLAIKYGITLINGIGTVDSDYRGEIMVPLINLSNKDFKINKGDRIAQLIICEYKKIIWFETNNLDSTNRDINGFGSTGI